MGLTLEAFHTLCQEHGVHTVRGGHTRHLRAPPRQKGSCRPVLCIGAFVGLRYRRRHLVMDMQNDLPDNEFINMDSGFLDCHLHADVSTGRILTHRPGMHWFLPMLLIPMANLIRCHPVRS